MFARRLANSVSPRSIHHAIRNTSHFHRPRYSSSWTGSQQAAAHSTSTSTGGIQPVIAELDRLCPRIDIDSDELDILEEPKVFFKVLKEKISQANRRIFLATLYVGKSEEELVACLQKALRKNSQLKLSILTDALRGTRESPEESCASLLSRLAAEFPSQVEIRMYHTPNLTGLKKKLLPARLNEGWGLQHMKLYGVDDEIILSGANLSNDYFTNRQDRYHLFSSKQVTDYFARVHDSMCRMSFRLVPGPVRGDYRLDWPIENACESPLVDAANFIDTARRLFKPLVTHNAVSPLSPGPGKASVFPVLIVPHALNTELPALRTILDPSSKRLVSCMFTAGYFNPDRVITDSILTAAKSGCTTTIVTASPWANGFYGSKGVSGMLPAAYTLFARRFIQAASQFAPGMVSMQEWRLGTVGRPHGWTYHAKGVWLSLQSSAELENAAVSDRAAEDPCVTIIGSSNYTVRSYSLDTEAGAIIVTEDMLLRSKLAHERDNLMKHSREVTQADLAGGERRVGPIVRLAIRIVQAIGGSL